MAQDGLSVTEPGPALAVLRLLSSERRRTAGALARALDCAPGDVRSQVDALRALGAAIDGRPERGYRLAAPIEWLERDRILEHLSTECRARVASLDIVGAIDSTNAALGRLPADTIHGRFLLAECQERGRGRRGRSWFSPPGGNLYLSAGWRFDAGIAALSALPLALALAVCDALEAVGLDGHGIKWPNDLWLDGRKLGGCLVELRGDPGGPCAAVLGVGLNVRMPAEHGAQAIGQPWIDVASALPGVSRNRLAAELLRAVPEHAARFEKGGFDAFAAAWERRDVLGGRTVSVRLPEERVSGVALGVGSAGELRVQTADGVRGLHAGDASLSG